MQKNGASKMMKFVFCICITVLGVFMTFFYNPSGAEEKMVNETMKQETSSEEDVKEKVTFVHAENELQLPNTENVSDEEAYNKGMDAELYFSNTSVIDQGNLPLEVHAVLVNSAQKYLNRSGYEDVSELYVEEESYIEDETYIVFSCYMDGYSEKLRIEFDFNDSNLKFSIIN